MNRNATLRPSNVVTPWALLAIGPLLAAACDVLPARVARADVVLVAPSKPNDPPIRRTGEVVDHTGKGLVLNAISGRTMVVPAHKVLRIETDRCPSHRKGDSARFAGRFEAALPLYMTALRDRKEQRPWVRRRIAGSVIACLHALGQHDQACMYYAAILGDDPDSPQQHAAPLAWLPSQRVPIAKARAWLIDDVAWIRLLGASYLLATDRRASAQVVLEQLEQHDTDAIRHLAAAQQWRRKIATATKEEIDDWSATTDRLPAALRAGPDTLMGHARAARGQHEAASLLSMRVPILYAHERQLAAEALLVAGKSLTHLDRVDEAARVFSELIRDHPKATASAEARQRLETLQKARNVRRPASKTPNKKDP